MSIVYIQICDILNSSVTHSITFERIMVSDMFTVQFFSGAIAGAIVQSIFIAVVMKIVDEEEKGEY